MIPSSFMSTYANICIPMQEIIKDIHRLQANNRRYCIEENLINKTSDNDK